MKGKIKVRLGIDKKAWLVGVQWRTLNKFRKFRGGVEKKKKVASLIIVSFLCFDLWILITHNGRKWS